MSPELESLLIDGLDDWSEASWLVSELCIREGESLTLPQARSTVIAAVRELLEAGLVDVGGLGGDGRFVAWGLSIEETIARIEDEWDALGAFPGMGELFWLDNTPAGDAVANAALEQDDP